MKKILIIPFLFLSFNAFGQAIQDYNPWSSIKKNLDDLNIKSIIVKSSNIGSARIVKKIEGIANLDVSKPITAEEIEEMKNHDNKKCILWFDGTEFCVFK
jgi:ribosome maturation protein Sdo1